MANQKNKNKKNNSHKHVYGRKKNPKKGNNRVKNKEKHNTTQGNIQHQHTDERINRAYVLLISIVWKEVE